MPERSSHPWSGEPVLLPPKTRQARKAYLDQWRDRMALAYTAGCTDAGAIVERRHEMAWKEHT